MNRKLGPLTSLPIPLIPSKIAQYETAEKILVKMRQPHDERNTDWPRRRLNYAARQNRPDNVAILQMSRPSWPIIQVSSKPDIFLYRISILERY